MKKKILLIDDDPAILRFTEKLLSRIGFDVEAYTDGCIGLGCFISSPQDFDLVLIDYSMKGCNAIELIHAIQKTRKGIPLIVMSGYDEETIGINEWVPSVAYLQKPFMKEDLQQILSECRQRTNTTETPAGR